MALPTSFREFISNYMATYSKRFRKSNKMYISNEKLKTIISTISAILFFLLLAILGGAMNSTYTNTCKVLSVENGTASLLVLSNDNIFLYDLEQGENLTHNSLVQVRFGKQGTERICDDTIIKVTPIK